MEALYVSGNNILCKSISSPFLETLQLFNFLVLLLALAYRSCTSTTRSYRNSALVAPLLLLSVRCWRSLHLKWTKRTGTRRSIKCSPFNVSSTLEAQPPPQCKRDKSDAIFEGARHPPFLSTSVGIVCAHTVKNGRPRDEEGLV